MDYTEINRTTDTIVTVTVEFTFNFSGQTITEQLSIPIFNPQGEDDIANSVENRYQTELNNLSSQMINNNDDINNS